MHRSRASSSLREVEAELRACGSFDVDATRRRRAEYSSDASNYRVAPLVVVFPRGVDDVLAIADVSRRLGVPLTARGAGTSVAGNSVGPGIVIDFSRHMNRIQDLDPGSRTAVVEPGVVLGSLQQAAAPHGLRFGPDPSTWARCTIGGMIGNNACGPRALAFGRTADNVVALDVVDGQGRRFSGADDLAVVPGLDAFVARDVELLRTELGTFGRQISGYSLEHLLPENGHSLARSLVGTEGSCVVVLGATVRLVPVPVDPLLVVLGYEGMADAADAVPSLLPHRPMAIEGLDARLVDAVRRHQGSVAVPALPRGGGWLMVEVADVEDGDAVERARRLIADSGATDARIILAGPEARAMWRIREDGAGLAGRTPEGRQAWPGLEDAAVPPERLGAYLREFEKLLDDYGFQALPYGHFGDGCVHVRLDIPLEVDGSVLRSFMLDAAERIASHGGSLSGEHGDGRARGELLPRMYSDRMIRLFAEFKALFDPADLLNPGVIVSPAPLDQNLRRPAALTIVAGDGFAFGHDDGDFTRAAHRCVGVGKCRVDGALAAGFMCPSYRATRDEKDSTRGRARVLQEMLNGTLVDRSWRSPEVADALDLCLSCKACASDCPAGVDMAALKSEVLHRRYRRRVRPRTHYTLGWLPRWTRIVAPVAPLANAALSVRWIERLLLRLGGMDPRRSIPRFARPFTRRVSTRASGVGLHGDGPAVVLWVDTFVDGFAPSIASAAVELLEDAGVRVVLPARRPCCGLTWITTGQLTAARRRLRGLLDAFAPFAAAGIPILGLEPSCTAVLRSDLLELLPNDARSKLVAEHVLTLAELIDSPRSPLAHLPWRRPDLTGTKIILQPHCHHHSVMGSEADVALLRGLGAEVTPVAGCCGLAGNFGMERGHFDVSVAVAEHSLLKALRDGADESILLADGLSCRTQAAQLAGVQGVHLAELLRGEEN